jgi:glycogen operon protein
MRTEDWQRAESRALGMQFGNDAADGRRFLLVMNAAPTPSDFRLAPNLPGASWISLFETARPEGIVEAPRRLAPGGALLMEPRSLILFQHQEV